MRMLAHHRCDKGVAAAGVVGDIASARSAIPKRVPQRRDMDAQGAVIDDRIRPGAGDQLFLGDHFAGVLDQCDQNIERTTAEAQRLPVVKQHSLRRDQPERSEDKGLVIHGGTVLPTRGFIQRPLNFAKIDGMVPDLIPITVTRKRRKRL